MSKKKAIQTVGDDPVIETTADKVLVYKASKAMSKAEFDLAADMLRGESEKTGIKITLMPYSVGVGE